MKTIGSHTHQFNRVVRRKGNRVRYVCDVCVRMGPWIRFLNPEVMPKTDVPDLDSLTVKDLRTLAKANGLTGYSSMAKPQLIDLLGGDTHGTRI